MGDAICFDLFGTLCDQSSVRETFTETVGDATDIPPEEVNAAYESWRNRHSMYTFQTAAMGISITHREVRERSLEYALERHGITLPAVTREALLDAHAQIEAYPDVADALADLDEAGFEMVVLSNGDPSLLREIVTNAGIDRYLDRVISAGDGGVFKPAPATYRHASQVLDRPIGTCWLVSAHAWDARGGAQAGMLGAWVNRDGRPDDRIGRRPAVVVDSFETLVDEMLRHL